MPGVAGGVARRVLRLFCHRFRRGGILWGEQYRPCNGSGRFMDNDVNLRTLVNDGGSAVISDYGAHLLRWAPAGQPDVVWTPSTWRIEPGKPLGGGVPICFPWFGPGFAHGRQLAITHPTDSQGCAGGRWMRRGSPMTGCGM